jgi:hypothetical protein
MGRRLVDEMVTAGGKLGQIALELAPAYLSYQEAADKDPSASLAKADLPDLLGQFSSVGDEPHPPLAYSGRDLERCLRELPGRYSYHHRNPLVAHKRAAVDWAKSPLWVAVPLPHAYDGKTF